MSTISFKTDEDFKGKLEQLAKKKGINLSAYIKLTLTKGVNCDLSEITENGLTVAEELEILASDKSENTSGPYTSSKSLMDSLMN